MKFKTVTSARSLAIAFMCMVGLAGQTQAISETAKPKITGSAADAKGFVPDAWRLEHTVRGDLNGDSSDDLAIVLRKPYNPPARTSKSDAGAPFDPMQRVLVIALHDSSNGRYRLAHQDHAIIPDRFSGNVEDYLAGPDPLEISKGVLRLRLDVFLSAGGWETSSRTFSFRLQDDKFVLIGFDRQIIHRGTGKQEELSINYLTGEAKLGEGSIEDDALKVTWKKISRRAFLTIGDIGNGLEFDSGF